MSLSGQLVQFGIAGQFVGGAITDASGKATLNSPLPIGVPTGQLANGVIASFAGDATYAPVNARGNLSVSPADTAIAVDNVFGAFPQAGSVTLTAHVTARSPSTATVNEGPVKFNQLDARNKSGAAANDCPGSNGIGQARFSLAGLPPGRAGRARLGHRADVRRVHAVSRHARLHGTLDGADPPVARAVPRVARRAPVSYNHLTLPTTYPV